MKLNENPDTVKLNGRNISYTRDDAVSFFLFEDGFIIWSRTYVLEKNIGHYYLGQMIKMKDKNEEEITSSSDYQNWENSKKYLKFFGEKTESTEKSLEIIKNKEKNYNDVSSSEMMTGRLWHRDEIVSFWSSSVPYNLRLKVVEFIKTFFGKEKEYTYELGGIQYSYKQFISNIELEPPPIFLIKGKEYSIQEIEKLRTDIHTKVGIEAQKAKYILCNLLDDETIENYPILKGYIPPDCTENEPKISFSQLKHIEKSKTKQDFLKSLKPSKETPETWGSGFAKGIAIPPGLTRLQTKYFLRSQAKEYDDIILKPEDLLGKTSNPFRSRTQKELDAAWDQLKFKEWLILNQLCQLS